MNQPQREALLDLLILSIFTDSHVSVAEEKALETACESVGWDSPKPRDIFILTSTSRARKASETEAGMADYMAKRAGAFTDSESQGNALNLIQGVLAGDGIAPAETAFLDRLRAAFGRK
jgi:hypothetical protein